MTPILVLTYWSYKDALIQTYTLPYAKIIARVSKRKVFIVCLEQPQLATSTEKRNQINISLIQDNIQIIFFDYHRFGIKQAFIWGLNLCKLFYLILKQRIGYIHVWCTPAGAIGYLLSIFTGKPLILDSYEPHAEAMVENGTWKRESIAFRILFWLEKKQSKRAIYFIAAASGMKNYAEKAYGINIDNAQFFVKAACTDLDLFYPQKKDQVMMEKLDLKNKVVCVYAGKLGGIYLDEEVFDFFKQCYVHWGDNLRVVMLTNANKETIDQQLKRVQLPVGIVDCRFVLHDDIPKYMCLGDFALNPVKPVPTKRYCTSIKDGEYWATALPVVITANISDDSNIIQANNAGYVLKELTITEYKNAIKKIEELLHEDTDKLKERIRALANKYRNFEIAENIYKKIYADKFFVDN